MGLSLQTERSDIIMHDDHITILIRALSLFIITAESWAWNHVSILSEHNYHDIVCPHILSRMLWYNVGWLHAMCFTSHLQERSCNQECFHSLHICIVLCKKDHSCDKTSWPSHDMTIDKLQHCLWGWLVETPHRLKLPISFLFPYVVLRVKEDWSWFFVGFFPSRDEVYSLNVWHQSFLCWWGLFSFEVFRLEKLPS